MLKNYQYEFNFDDDKESENDSKSKTGDDKKDDATVRGSKDFIATMKNSE